MFLNLTTNLQGQLECYGNVLWFSFKSILSIHFPQASEAQEYLSLCSFNRAMIILALGCFWETKAKQCSEKCLAE